MWTDFFLYVGVEVRTSCCRDAAQYPDDGPRTTGESQERLLRVRKELIRPVGEACTLRHVPAVHLRGAWAENTRYGTELTCKLWAVGEESEEMGGVCFMEEREATRLEVENFLNSVRHRL